MIDYVEYARQHDLTYSAVEYHAISPFDLEKAAQEQGVSFKQGDILLVRSGVTKWYNECTDAAARDGWFASAEKSSVGVAPTDEAVAWVWNHHFAAVAGDALAWEPIPYPADRPCESVPQCCWELVNLWKHFISTFCLCGVRR